MTNEYIPENKAWLVFDLCNGNPGSRQYVWWFKTRKEARDHIKQQHSNKRNARLSAPKRWILDV